MLIFLLFLIFVDLIVYFASKNRISIICCSILVALFLFNIILTLNELALVPNLFDIEIIFCLILELVLFMVSFKNTRLVALFTLVIILSGIGYFILREDFVEKNIDNKSYIGLYDSFLGTSETKVFYYEIYNGAFVSTKCYCIENYGIILSGVLNIEVITPTSVEYLSE